MEKIAYIGLSGPTNYDYINRVKRGRNHAASAPNPILENAFGLAIFYDEIWFLCESLCPYSLRGHSKIKFVDKIARNSNHPNIKERIEAVLKNGAHTDLELIYPAEHISATQISYFERLKMAGLYWCEEDSLGIDDHTRFRILGVDKSASPRDLDHLLIDIEIVKILKEQFNIEIVLNSISKLLYNAIAPSQYNALIQSSTNIQASSYIINARISNLVGKSGPSPEVFDKIYNSAFVPDFRNFINQKDISEASSCYIEIANEIQSAIKKEMQNKAMQLRPTKGIANIATDLTLDALGLSIPKKLFDFYISTSTEQPISAAAFLLDLTDD